MTNLIVDDTDRVRVLTLNRPESLNAFDTSLYDAVARALHDAAARDDVACAVVTGAGRAFSAGQDLGEMGGIDTAAADASGHGFPRFMDALSEFPKPLLAAVNGVGVGVGTTLLLHCDLVLMADTARLRVPFVPLGVVPEAASSVLLPVVMGAQRSALALYTGDWLSADDAVASGLALRSVPAGELLDETMALARRIASMPVVSLVETKRLVLAARIDAVRAARVREDETFARLVGGPANMEAIMAFLEKRDPDFSAL